MHVPPHPRALSLGDAADLVRGHRVCELSTQGRRKSSQDQPCFLTHHSDFLGLIAWGASVTELRHG